jgi:hypothetical protein
MILDTLLQFSSAQAVTSTGDTASTNVVDVGTTDAGAGEELFLFITTTEAVTSAGAATVQFGLQTSTDNSTFNDAVLSAAIAKASLTAGATIKLRLPVGLSRYNRVVYRVGTAALTAGKFSAYIAKDVPVQAAYASGYTVS